MKNGEYRKEKGKEKEKKRVEEIKVRGGEDVKIEVWEKRKGKMIIG